MKKTALVILSLLCFTASAMPLAARGFSAINASADWANTQTDKLVSPLSYEEYLSLSDPADIAVSEDYTAIADNSVIYIFDRARTQYRAISISSVTSGAITKIQFDENENLYFLDSLMDFYCVNLATDAVTLISSLQCTTFLIEGNKLFYTTASGGKSKLFVTQLSAPDKSTASELAQNLSGTPALAYWNEELYFTDESSATLLFKIDPDTKERALVTLFNTAIATMSIEGGVLACSTETENFKGDFCTYPVADVSENSPLSKEEGSYSAVASFGEYFYTIEDTIVKQYSIKNKAFTNYEICSSSSSINRLSGATATFLAGNMLYIADNGNARISVYNTATGTYLPPIATDVSPKFISADKQTLLIANENQATLYDLTSEPYTETASFKNFSGNIVGVAGVYGKYYLVSDSNCFYSLSQQENGEWTIRETQKNSTRYPKLLTADAYGELYILSGNDVYSFTEQTFEAENEEGVEICAGLPANITQIAVDYEQNVYALSENKIYRYLGDEPVSFETPLVYYPDPAAKPQINAFAFGIEENTTYVLCENNYLFTTSRLQLPTVKTIAVGDADDKVFENASAEFTVVQTHENALLVQFDIQTMGGATYFPYVATERSVEQKTALKIGESGKYELLAYFNQTENKYYTYLALKTACTALPADEYHTAYGEDEQKTGYLTNDIALYKFPYLTELLTAGELLRGAQITVLGEIDKLDHAYYHVRVETENGDVFTGYVPKTYVNNFSGLPPQSELYQAGAPQSDHDSVWRLAYLVLGFGAICILTDYLILKKKKDE